MYGWICELSENERWFKVQATVSMINVSVTYPAQLTISLVYFMYLTWFRPEEVVMRHSATAYAAVSVSTTAESSMGSQGPYAQYYASSAYYTNSNIDLERHLAATKPSFFLFIHMVSCHNVNF